MPAPLADEIEVKGPWLSAALALVAVVLAARAVSLALATGTPATSEPGVGETHRVVVAADLPTPPMPAVDERARLTDQEFAAIAGLCPTALGELPPELLPLSARRGTAEARSTEAAASGRLTGVRLASRGPRMPLLTEPRVAQAVKEPAEGWLVEPDAWFVPEDQAAAVARPPAAELQPELPRELPSDGNEPEERVALPEPSAEPLADPLPMTTDAAPANMAGEQGDRPIDTPADVDVTPWPVDAEPSSLDPTEVEASPTPYYGFPSTDASQPDANAAENLADQPADEDDPVAAPSYEGPSFAPPGVAPPEVTAPEPTPAPPTYRAEPIEPAAPSPAPELPEAPSAEPVESKASPRWGGDYDSVVPDPHRKTAPSWSGSETSEAEPRTEPEAATDPLPAVKPELLSAPAPKATSAPATPVAPASPAPAETLPKQPAPQVVPIEPERPVAGPAVAPVRPLFDKPTVHPGGGAKAAAAAKKAAGGKTADESHRELFAKSNYPSALECAACHQRIYDEWSVSSHAYAFVSPMFHKFEQTITNLSNGTVGHFCQRCHSPVATAMNEPRSVSLNDVATTAREGVTCIVCHRVNQRWGKSNGERRIEPGDIYAPIYGGVGGDGVAKAIADKKGYKVKTSTHEKGPGQAIHNEGRFFDQLTQAEACTSCHQVAVHPGVKLEVVWEQYRASPACEKGVTCQECHMGKVPGMAGGYNYGPVAELNGKTVNNHRKQSSHVFYGPGYSIAHPGVFPQNKDAMKWQFNDWLAYDWRAGWGTDDFEERLDEMEDRGVDTSVWFPKVWADPDDRADAREIIEGNLERLKVKRQYRELVMENGSKVDGPFFRQRPAAGRDLKFEYLVANRNEGHNLPTASLGAQPQLWANVVLIGPDGRRLWESGYTDSNGDLCDIHSVDVRHGRIPFDKQLFNLQTMFLISGATGTDREFYLPVNLDIDQVAHLRPGNVPFSVLNHPPFIRMESRSIAPLGKKRVKYTVPAELMRQRGRYRLSFRLRNRTEPMYFMRLCEATPEMHRAMTEGTLDIHPQSVEFNVP